MMEMKAPNPHTQWGHAPSQLPLPHVCAQQHSFPAPKVRGWVRHLLQQLAEGGPGPKGASWALLLGPLLWPFPSLRLGHFLLLQN